MIFEKNNAAYVLKNHLKVMLEEDYVALKHNALSGVQVLKRQKTGAFNSISSKVLRAIIIPELEKEVNEGKNFAGLRQVYSGMILAAWYKRALKESLLGRIYANKSRLKGVDQDPKNNEAIYHRYLQAYKKGVYNYIKEDSDKYTNELIPRKYFSGGACGYSYAMSNIPITMDAAQLSRPEVSEADLASTVQEEYTLSQAMTPRSSLGKTIFGTLATKLGLAALGLSLLAQPAIGAPSTPTAQVTTATAASIGEPHTVANDQEKARALAILIKCNLAGVQRSYASLIWPYHRHFEVRQAGDLTYISLGPASAIRDDEFTQMPNGIEILVALMKIGALEHLERGVAVRITPNWKALLEKNKIEIQRVAGDQYNRVINILQEGEMNNVLIIYNSATQEVVKISPNLEIAGSNTLILTALELTDNKHLIFIPEGVTGVDVPSTYGINAPSARIAQLLMPVSEIRTTIDQIVHRITLQERLSGCGIGFPVENLEVFPGTLMLSVKSNGTATLQPIPYIIGFTMPDKNNFYTLSLSFNTNHQPARYEPLFQKWDTDGPHRIDPTTLTPEILRQLDPHDFLKKLEQGSTHQVGRVAKVMPGRDGRDYVLVKNHKGENHVFVYNPYGGIDFNAEHLKLQIKRDDTGVPLPINRQKADHILIDGLETVILGIIPMNSLTKPSKN
ncbi:MAG: hypothetical protein HQL13_02545 [Candidatus Omnitrophica bacterium]|nr:hypothetical protein [Candidatus Omnitrophota bacterium]